MCTWPLGDSHRNSYRKTYRNTLGSIGIPWDLYVYLVSLRVGKPTLPLGIAMGIAIRESPSRGQGRGFSRAHGRAQQGQG